MNRHAVDASFEVSPLFRLCIPRGALPALPEGAAVDEWAAGHSVAKTSLVMALGTGWAGFHGVGDSTTVTASVAFQGLASHVPATRIPENAAATELAIKQAAAAIWVNKSRAATTMCRTFTDRYVEWTAEGSPGRGLDSGQTRPAPADGVVADPAPAANYLMEEIPFPAAVVIDAAAIPLMTAIALLRVYGASMDNRKDFLTGLYTHFIVSFSKRGECSQRKGNSILKEINDGLGRNVAYDPELIKLMWRMMGSFIGAETAGPVLKAIEAMLGDDPETLRLRLTAQQAVRSGLTSICLIVQAVREYPYFYWIKVSQMFPAEMANVIAALDTIGNNPYYGFNTRMGNVKATGYRNITYIAKQLHMRIGGMHTLSGLAGQVTMPMYADRVERMIQEYVSRHGAAFDGESADADKQLAANLFARATASSSLRE